MDLPPEITNDFKDFKGFWLCASCHRDLKCRPSCLERDWRNFGPRWTNSKTPVKNCRIPSNSRK